MKDMLFYERALKKANVLKHPNKLCALDSISSGKSEGNIQHISSNYTDWVTKKKVNIKHKVNNVTGKVEDSEHPNFMKKESIEEAIKIGTFREYDVQRLSASSPKDLTNRYIEHVGAAHNAYAWHRGDEAKKFEEKHLKAAQIIHDHVKKEHGVNAAKALRVAGKHAGHYFHFDGGKQDRLEKLVSKYSTKKFGDYIPKNARGKINFNEELIESMEAWVNNKGLETTSKRRNKRHSKSAAIATVEPTSMTESSVNNTLVRKQKTDKMNFMVKQAKEKFAAKLNQLQQKARKSSV